MNDALVFFAFVGIGIIGLVPWVIGIGVIVSVVGSLELWNRDAKS